MIIAGSRGITDHEAVESAVVLALEAFLVDIAGVHEIVCGCSDGVDQAGWQIARDHGIPVTYFPAWPFQAQWAVENIRFGELIHPMPAGTGIAWKARGRFRNGTMARYADAALVVTNGSAGSANMIGQMRALGKPCHVVTTGNTEQKASAHAAPTE